MSGVTLVILTNFSLTHNCIYIHIYIFLYNCINIYKYKYMIYMYRYIYIYIIYIIYIYIYIYIYNCHCVQSIVFKLFIYRTIRFVFYTASSEYCHDWQKDFFCQIFAIRYNEREHRNSRWHRIILLETEDYYIHRVALCFWRLRKG